MGTVVDDAAAAEFHAFFEAHYAELARPARLLTGEADAADDLAADALTALWHRWDRVRGADHPVAYARGVVANLARTRIRSVVRERRRIALFWAPRGGGDGYAVEDPDVSAVVDVQGALRRLPFRKRACVVLRHAFDLSERDTSLVLGDIGRYGEESDLARDGGVAQAAGARGPGRARPGGRRGAAHRRKALMDGAMRKRLRAAAASHPAEFNRDSRQPPPGRRRPRSAALPHPRGTEHPT
ncbi:DNA-directed RNA polymerase specialized sigma subunit, sigma24 family [Streptomyces sp. PalvLS-984]|nr:DNA-directed RNA polymerase specialized sigma subunit, sigma24 family [Streptomyces sp. PalvLS-984]